MEHEIPFALPEQKLICRMDMRPLLVLEISKAYLSWTLEADHLSADDQ